MMVVDVMMIDIIDSSVIGSGSLIDCLIIWLCCECVKCVKFGMFSVSVV